MKNPGTPEETEEVMQAVLESPVTAKSLQTSAVDRL